MVARQPRVLDLAPAPLKLEVTRVRQLKIVLPTRVHSPRWQYEREEKMVNHLPN